MDNFRRRRVTNDTQVCGRGTSRNGGQKRNFFEGPGKGGVFCRRQNSRLELEDTEMASEAVVGSPIRTCSADLKILKEQAERMSRALRELEKQITTLEDRQ